MTVSAPRRILLTRLRFLGDVVLSLPLLEHLRERFPEASLEYLVEDRFADLLEGIDSVDRVHRLPRSASIAQTLRLSRALQRPRIDWWIDLLTNPRSCVLALLARPRESVGSARGLRSYVYRHRRERPPGNPSAIEHHLDKLNPLCGALSPRLPRLVVLERDRETLRRLFAVPHSPVLLHPGSTWPDKAWPQGSWLELIEHLGAADIGPLLLLTPPGEEETAEKLSAQTGIAAAPALPIRPLLALLEASPLYIGNDGGILHCAVALRRPTIGLFGPTDPTIWFPYEGQGPYRVLRGEEEGDGDGGSHPRLTTLRAEQVAEVARELWESR